MRKRSLILIMMILISFTVMGCSFTVDTKNGIKIGGDGFGKGKKYEVDEKKTIDEVGSINSINIDSEVADITFIPEDREDIEVVFEGYIRTSDEGNIHELEVDNNNGTVRIRTGRKEKSIVSVNSGCSFTLDVKVPEGIIKDLEIEVNVGEVKVSDIQLDELKVDSDVGDIKVENVSSAWVDVSSDVGDLNISLNEVQGDITLDSDTGDVKITIPENSDVMIDAYTNVGSIKSFIPGKEDRGVTGDKLEKSLGDGTHKLKLSTDVGSIHIGKK